MPDWHEGLISADWCWQGAHGRHVPRGRKPSCQALSGPGSRQPLGGRARSGLSVPGAPQPQVGVARGCLALTHSAS